MLLCVALVYKLLPWIVLPFINVTQCVYLSSLDGHLGCSQFRASAKSAAGIILVLVHWCVRACISEGVTCKPGVFFVERFFVFGFFKLIN